ncbi:FtsW/RodA/SpoVE family cell cycle protein [Fructilactobacillus vespulae]|uniref:FtsW/RodA/SpoVE family cell cycle protein n=1 Tax=Fructilactobacillus vespulae TaxID=1249630 RepID=UPI0039B50B40
MYNILKRFYNFGSKYGAKFDWLLVLPYLSLCIIGIVMVYSASAGIGLTHGGFANSYVFKQFLFVIVGMTVAFFTFHLPLKKIDSMKSMGLFCLIMAVVLIYCGFFGATINGASGWIRLGPISIQPAELCKFFFIIFFAHMFKYRNNKINNAGLGKALLFRPQPLVFPLIMLGLILFQPDMGGFAINIFIILVMLIAASTSFKSLSISSFIIMFLPLIITKFFMGPIAALISNTKSYQLQRLVSFENPFIHAKTSGAQLINSFYAISNGGIFGRGLGNSIQKMGYLAEPNTDFILPIISEELGLIGVIIVLGLILTMIYRIVMIGFKTTNIYNSTICYGTAAYLTIQTLFNAGGSVGAVPLTGVALPFISYGGSSMITLSLCIGMVLKISKMEAKKVKK